jgi:hypothetical protein
MQASRKVKLEKRHKHNAANAALSETWRQRNATQNKQKTGPREQRISTGLWRQ